MKLVAGDPCLDFVNTVGGREPAGPSPGTRVVADKLMTYLDLVAWGRHAGLLTDAAARRLVGEAGKSPREAARVFARATALREALYRTLRSLIEGTRVRPADLAIVNTELAAARSQERLAAGRHGLRWEWPEPEGLDAALWPVSRVAAALFASPHVSRLHLCGGEGCGWLFLDRSRNRSRRWCAMEDCGNVAKVRRFRQRGGRT